ncbi:MAG TPA: hypothetical protein VGM93_09160, partial [Acidimicrobiales bacterium]
MRATASRAAVAAAIVAMVALGLTSCTPTLARTDTSKAVLLVHGYNATSTSTDCQSEFGDVIKKLRASGFTGPMIRVGYYSGD